MSFLVFRPRWEDAPKWAKYRAMDEDGTWFWFEKKPECLSSCGWQSLQGRACQAGRFFNWTETLERRPASAKSQPIRHKVDKVLRLLRLAAIPFLVLFPWVVLALLFGSSVAKADEVTKLSEVVYQEAGGESVQAAAFTACAAVNRMRTNHSTMTRLIRSRVVKAKPIPNALRPYFKAIARTALAQRGELCKGADSWNRGSRPKYPGKVRGYAGKQVYYTMKTQP